MGEAAVCQCYRMLFIIAFTQILFFSLEQVRIDDAADGAAFASVGCDHKLLAVFKLSFQLKQHSRTRLGFIQNRPGLLAEIPAVSHQHGKPVFALVQQGGHIIALIIHQLLIGGKLRCKLPVVGTLAVHSQPVNAVSRGINARAANRGRSGKDLFKQYGRIAATIFVLRHGNALDAALDPAGLPGRRRCFKYGLR